jgi:hypothetical protein
VLERSHSPRQNDPETRRLSTFFLCFEYAIQGVEFARGLGNMPCHKGEFVVKVCDGRLLAFGSETVVFSQGNGSYDILARQNPTDHAKKKGA